MKIVSRLLGAIVLTLGVSSAHAGPIIIAGTDADDHGSFSGTVNETGWLFMQKAFENIGSKVTNGNKSVVCIGCNSDTAADAFASATGQSALNGTWSFTSLNSAADITAFFDGSGTVNLGNAGIVYMPTVENNISGGLTDDQLAIVNLNGGALNAYLAAGGGLFTQEQANSAIGYGWLTSLLPGLLVQGDSGGPPFDSGTLALTAEGTAAFPGLTAADLMSATPWHAWFSGNFGNLKVLATGPILDDSGAPAFDGAVVLGGGIDGAIVCGGPNEPPCPTPEPGSLPLLGMGVLAMAYGLRRRYTR